MSMVGAIGMFIKSSETELWLVTFQVGIVGMLKKG